MGRLRGNQMGRARQVPTAERCTEPPGCRQGVTAGSGHILPLPTAPLCGAPPPRRGWRATEGWRGYPQSGLGVTALLLPSPPHRRVPLPRPAGGQPGGAPLSSASCTRTPHHLHRSPHHPHHLHRSPHPAPHAASLRSAAAAPLYKPGGPGRLGGPIPALCSAPPGSAARRALPGPARSRTHLAASARLRCAPSAPGAGKEPPPEGRREP